MKIPPNILDIIKEKKSKIIALAKHHGAGNVRIFGSVIRGDFTENSDIDFLIKLAPHHSLLDVIALKQDLEDLLQCRVDVVTEAALSPYIRDEVIKSAVNL